MTAKERDQLIGLARRRAKQAEREAKAREKVVLAEVLDMMTAEFSAEDELWKEAVQFAGEAMEKANAFIRDQCALIGYPPDKSPQLAAGWVSRSPECSMRERRTELRKLAEARAAALTEEAKVVINDSLLAYETALVAGSLQSDEARMAFTAMPGVEELMPALSLEDLGVKRWQPPEDIAAQLTTPMTPTQRRKRQVLRAIEANPGASNRRIAEIAGVDPKTVAAHRREQHGSLRASSGEIPATGEEFPAAGEEIPPAATKIHIGREDGLAPGCSKLNALR